MQKTEFHRRRIFPGPSGGRGNGMRRSGESAGQRVAGGKAAGRQGGKAAGGRLQGSGRQDGGRQDGGRQGGKVAGRQSGRAAKWQGGKVAGRRSAGRQKKRGLRFFLKKIKNHFVRKSYVPASRRQGRVIAADRSGAPPAQTKKRDSNRREPPDSEKAHGEAARHLQKANAQVLNTLFGHREGCNIIRTAAVSKIIERNFSIFLHSDHSFQAHSRPLPWSFPFPELCPEAERVSVSANLRRHRAAFDLRFSILCTISHKILFYDVFTGFSRHAPTHVYGAARIHGAAPQ